MSIPVSQVDPFDELVDDFLARFRCGEHPSVDEYQKRYPEFAEKIANYFPALVVLEELGAYPSSQNDAKAEPVVPKKFGEFSIVREIGRGGMGIVYQAVQESLGREVALKILPDSVRFRENARTRFRREASAAARLHHTNIVPVFGFGEWQGVPYYAMQHIDGQSLDRVIVDVRQMTDRKATSQDADSVGTRFHPATEHLLTSASAETVECRQSEKTLTLTSSKALCSKVAYYRHIAVLGIQAAGALEHAHANGILHRDIKPSNLLLDNKGTLWITDFGLAKGLVADGVTQTGELIGTLRYMAPERFQGDADSRSDIYALGMTLYELLVLRPAFDEKDNPRLIAQILQQSPTRLRELDPQIPADLETIVEKAIRPDPKDRYASGSALAEDLSRFLADRPILARKNSTGERLLRWYRRNRTLAAMTCVTFLALLTVAIGSLVSAVLLQHQVGLLAQAQQQQKMKLFEAQVEKARALVWSQRVGQHFESLQAIRDAMAIAHELTISNDKKLELRNLAITALILPDVQKSGQSAKLPDRVSVDTIQCSRDLEWYLTIDKYGKLSRVRTSDHEIVESFPAFNHVQQADLSPDDNAILVQHSRDQKDCRLAVVNLKDTASAPSSIEESRLLHGSPFSADSRWFLVLANDDHLSIRETISAKLVKKMAVKASAGSWAASQPSSGYWAVLTADGVTMQLIDTVSDRILAECNTQSSGEVGSLIWNSTGSLLMAEIGPLIQVWNATDGKLRLISIMEKQQNSSVYPRFVPKCDLVCWSCWDGTCQLWDPVAARNLLRFSGTFVGLHHDGEHLLLRDADGQSALWLLSTGAMCRTLHHGLAGNRAPKSTGWVRNADFSPDGRVLATTGIDVRFWDVAKGTELGSLALGKCCGVFQPGNWRYITSSAQGIQIWPVEPYSPIQGQPLRFGSPTKLGVGNSDSEAFPQWSPDGRFLCWVEGEHAVLWDQATASLVQRYGPIKHLRYVGLTSNADLVVLGPYRGESRLEVWERGTSRRVFQLPCDTMTCPYFSRDGRWLYLERIQGNNRQLQVWITSDWREERLLPSSPRTAGICFTPDSRFLARGIAPGLITLFDLQDGTPVASLSAPLATHHYSMTCSPQGDYLAVANMDHSFHLWKLDALRLALAELGLDW